jgi:hypothetical protein
MKPTCSTRRARLGAIAFAIAALLGAMASGADEIPQRIGPDFQVNTFTQFEQFTPDVARFRDGRFVVVWEDIGEAPISVKGQLYQASGAREGTEFRVSTGGPIFSPPSVAALPDGGFAVVWADFHDIRLRRFDRTGQPLGNATVVNGPHPEPNRMPDIAASPAGNVAVGWHRDGFFENMVLFRRLDAAGQAQGDPVQVNTFLTGDPYVTRVAVNDEGSVLVSWQEGFGFQVMVRRFDGPTGTLSNELKLRAPFGGAAVGGAPVLYPEGDGAVVFGDLRFVDAGIFVQRLDAEGKLLGNATEIGGGGLSRVTLFDDPDVAIGPDGKAFVVWSRNNDSEGFDSRIHGRLLDRTWQPLGDVLTVSPVFPQFFDQEPAVAADASGGFVAVWTNGQFSSPIPFPIPVPSLPADGRDGSGLGIFGQLFGDPDCAADSETLCLGEGNRFRVKVDWKIPSGETGAGHARRLTADTGALWFFGPDNLELMVKVLDARSVNGHFWFYLGSLSNVEYTVTVTDTATGSQKTYHNAPRQFASFADVEAFAEVAPVSSSARGLVATVPVLHPQLSPSSCSASTESLCLAGQFQVEVDFVDPRTETAGRGTAIPLTADTGAFWFFSPSNLELTIKILDGRAVNGNFWVFFGALSDVQYTITVTDTATGQKRTYVNPRGQLASHADIEAFD